MTNCWETGGSIQKCSYSDISKTLLATYATNSSCIEDSKQISDQISEKSQGYRLCSPDVRLNSFKELGTESTASRSESGIEYKFNNNPALTDLAVKGLIQCRQVDTNTDHVFDHDNQFIPTEKYDAKFSYKKVFGYFPGIAQIDEYHFYVENRDGNDNVKYIQSKTFEKAYLVLEENGIKVGQSRKYCGSYPKETVETVAKHSRLFYFRANRCETLLRRISEIDDSAWEDVEINYIKCQLSSIPFTAFWMRNATGSSCSAP
ncbi:MAG: hypothetical protein MJZ41_15405 [Bacteroidaceae bacterium]|nr:hypothetical protein [Bacteroidaceae bacterium]